MASDGQVGIIAVKTAGPGLQDEEIAKVMAAGHWLGKEDKKAKFVWVAAGHFGLIGNEWADEIGGKTRVGEMYVEKCVEE